MTTAASDFIDFIEWLNESATPYFIAWGYEKLPEHPSGGDVDMYVHPAHYSIVAKELEHLGYSPTRCPAFNENHKHAQFSRTGKHTIDLFSSFCFAFMGKTTVFIADPTLVLHGRTKMKQFWVSSPIIETLFSLLRVIGGRKDCMERATKYLRSQ